MPRGHILYIGFEVGESDTLRALLKPLPVQIDIAHGVQEAINIRAGVIKSLFRSRLTRAREYNTAPPTKNAPRSLASGAGDVRRATWDRLPLGLPMPPRHWGMGTIMRLRPRLLQGA